MRRSKYEIKEPGKVKELLERAQVMRLGMCDEGRPYVVPLNFGVEDNCLYFHGSKKGMKMDILARNPQVCFEVDLGAELIPAPKPCNWGARYQSVIGFGRAVVVEDEAEKVKGLNAIMRKYSGQEFEYPEKEIKGVCLVRIDIESMTGKQVGY